MKKVSIFSRRIRRFFGMLCSRCTYAEALPLRKALAEQGQRKQ
jgi:hypothetical protein